MNKYSIYIGSNNATNELESDKARTVIARYFQGFSEYEITGVWNGTSEKTLKVEIVAEKGTSEVAVVALCKELAKELQQDAIMLEQVESNTAFIKA